MATTPFIAPDGSHWEIPIDKIPDATAGGGKPAVWMKGPDGSVNIIPRENAAAAMKDGGRAFGSLQALQQDNATKAASEAGPPKWYGFTPGNILKNAWEGGKQLVTGAGELGKDLLTNPDWVEGKNSTLEKFVIQPSEREVVKAGQHGGAAGEGQTFGEGMQAAGHALASAIPFVGPWAANLGEQAGSGDVGGAAGKAAGTVATGAAIANAGNVMRTVNDLAAKGAKVVGDIGTWNPDVASVPGRLAKGLGQISADPQDTLATYGQALPHLKDIARDVESAGGKHTAAQVFQSTGAKIQELGRPIEAAIRANANTPAGGSPALDAALRERAKAEVGTPDVLTQAQNPTMMKLYAIGQGQGPMTIGEMDTIRRYAGDQSGPYFNALNRGDQAAVRAWKEAEAYSRNAEYGKLRDLTGLDVDQIQSDRAALIKVQDTAMKMWARDLGKSPTNLAQSIGIPFGASRIISGGLSTLAGNPGGLMEMASGAAEVGAFSTWKELQSAQHTLGSAMRDLAHSDLKGPDYRIQQPPPGPQAPLPFSQNNPPAPAAGSTISQGPGSATPAQQGVSNVPTKPTTAPGAGVSQANSPAAPGGLPTFRQPAGAVASNAAGSATSIRVPGSETTVPAHYDVRELDSLRPSHSGINFNPTEGYNFQNERDYGNAANQRGVITNSAKGKFDPSYHITDNPDLTNGPPAISPEGDVLGGNERTMTLQRVYRYNPDGATQYKDALASKAAQFGLDPVKIQGMKKPVLVRVLDDSDTGNAQRLVAEFNKTGTKALTPSERAISDAKRVSPETLEDINSRVAKLGPSATLAGAMADSGPEMIDKLIQDGIISPQEKGALVGKAGLTDAGKQRISNLMIGRFFDDPSQLDQTPASVRVKLERLSAPLANAATIQGWDITPAVKEAVNALQEARAHNIQNINDLVSQSGMFGNSKYSPECISIASHILKDNPLRLVKAARAYAEDAQNAGGKQAGVFGAVSQKQSFQEAFGGAR